MAKGGGEDSETGNGLGEAPAPIDRNSGHRERARQRFLRIGEEALDDYELLELILFLAIPRVDTKGLAKELLARFGTYSNVLSAPPERLAEVKGISEATATNLKIIQAAAQRFARDRVPRDMPILGSWQSLIDYVHTQMAFNDIEQFRILFLDTRNRLIADEAQARGTVNHTPVYPREVVRRALELQATALILVHNHPSGVAEPSRADEMLTQTLKSALLLVDVRVIDHLIVAGPTILSFAERGLI